MVSSSEGSKEEEDRATDKHARCSSNNSYQSYIIHPSPIEGNRKGMSLPSAISSLKSKCFAFLGF